MMTELSGDVETEHLQARTINNGSSNLWEITLKKTNREALFSDAVTAIRQNQDEAQLVLSNLQRLAPDLASNFGIRTPDQIYDTPFKVICESDNGDFPFAADQPVKQFLAVSYCWRHANHDWPADGSLPDSPWPFSKPFADAVLDERGIVSEDGRHPDFRRECIFVDKLCIDQQDEVVKQRSIAMMDVIYKTCRKLMILLEDVVFTEAEIEAVARIGYDHITPGPGLEIDADDLPYLTSAWRKVERSRWWGRSWCWHEFQVNEPWETLRCSYYVHCATLIVRNATGGTFKMRWLQLLWLRAETALHYDVDKPYTVQELQNASRWTIAENRTSGYGDSTDRSEGSVRSSVMARLYVINNTKSAIATDLISIAINLSGLALYYRKDNTLTRNEVVWIVTTLALAAGEKSPLVLMKDTMLNIDGRESWLSEKAAEYNSDVPRFVLGSNIGLHAVTPYSIELDLLFFEHHTPWALQDDLALTKEIFPEDVIVTTTAQYHGDTAPLLDDKGDEAWDISRRTFLAQACKGGMKFILRLWSQLSRDVVQHWRDSKGVYETFQANETLRPNASVMLAHFAGAVQGDLREEYLDTLLLFLTWLIDTRSTYYISVFTLRVACAEDEFALVSGLLSRSITDSSPKKWRLAIPTDLSDSPCGWHRVWVLQPKDGSGLRQLENGNWENTNGEYTIVAKMLLLGEPSLQPNSALQIRTRQVVTA